MPLAAIGGHLIKPPRPMRIIERGHLGSWSLETESEGCSRQSKLGGPSSMSTTQPRSRRFSAQSKKKQKMWLTRMGTSSKYKTQAGIQQLRRSGPRVFPPYLRLLCTKTMLRRHSRLSGCIVSPPLALGGSAGPAQPPSPLLTRGCRPLVSTPGQPGPASGHPPRWHPSGHFGDGRWQHLGSKRWVFTPVFHLVVG